MRDMYAPASAWAMPRLRKQSSAPAALAPGGHHFVVPLGKGQEREGSMRNIERKDRLSSGRYSDDEHSAKSQSSREETAAWGGPPHFEEPPPLVRQNANNNSEVIARWFTRDGVGYYVPA